MRPSKTKWVIEGKDVLCYVTGGKVCVSDVVLLFDIDRENGCIIINLFTNQDAIALLVLYVYFAYP